MINLRYHIVSIAAVFLAMAIGIAVGSTLVERATVEVLQARLDEQESRLDENDRQSQALAEELARADAAETSLLDEAAPQLLDGAIDEVPVLLLSPEGVGEETIGAARAAVVDGGGRFGGVLTLTEKAALDDPVDVDLLADLLDMSPNAPVADVRAELVARLGGIFFRASQPSMTMEASPETTTTTTTTTTLATSTSSTLVSEEGDGIEPADPDDLGPTPEEVAEAKEAIRQAGLDDDAAAAEKFISRLGDAGFVRFDGSPLGGLEVTVRPESGAQSVVVVDPNASTELNPLLISLLQNLSDEGPAPSVVVESARAADANEEDEDGSGSEPESAPSLVARIRLESSTLHDTVSTVDHIERFAGRVAAVLALADIPEQVGHYGTELDADVLVPPEL